MIPFETVYDLINWVRIKVDEDDISAEDALDMLEQEISDLENDD